MQVVAIKLKDSHLLDDTSDQQCGAGSKSCPSTNVSDSQAGMNFYSIDPTAAKRDYFQAERKVNDYLILVLFAWWLIELVLSSYQSL